MKTIDQTIPVEVDEVKLVYQTKTPASQQSNLICSEKASKAFWMQGIKEHSTGGIIMIHSSSR